MRVILKGDEMRARLAAWREAASAADSAGTPKQKREADRFRLYEAPASFGYSKANGAVRLLGFAATFGHLMPKEWLEVPEDALLKARDQGLVRIVDDPDFPNCGTVYVVGTQKANEHGFMRALRDLCELMERDRASP